MSTITEAVNKLINVKAEKPTKERLEDVIEEVIDMLTDPTVLFVEWNALDIQQVAREKLSFMEDCRVDEIIDNPLRTEQVASVINILNARYDCNYGITWETINLVLDEISLPDSELCRKTVEEICIWTRQTGIEDQYDTDCGYLYDYGTNDKERDMFIYCPYCGKKIKEAE